MPRTPNPVANALLAAPLAPLAAALVVGIAAESWLSSLPWPASLPPLWIVSAALAVALLTLWAVWLRRRAGWPVRVALLIAVGLFLGVWRIGLTRHALESDHIARQLAADEQIVSLRGVVQSKPLLSRRVMPDFPAVMPSDSASTFIVSADEFRPGLADWRRASGLVKVRCAGPALHVVEGARYEFAGLLRPSQQASNPGAPDWRQANHDKRIFATLWLPTETAARPLDGPAAPPDASAWPVPVSAIRLRAHNLLLGQAEPLTDDDRLLLDGLILGARGEGLSELSQPFLRTGTYHYLAISGQHIGILAGFCWLVLRLCRIGPRRSAMAVLAIVTLYCLMAEPAPPVLRAGIMVAIACTGALLHRQVQSVNLLAAAAIILLLIDPGELFGAGFQLSFVAVLGLLLFAGPVYRWLARRVLRERPGEDPSGWSVDHPLTHRAARLGLQAAAISVAAWVTTIPLTAYYFSRFYPWGVLSSLVLGPSISLALWLSFIKMSLSLAAPTVGAWLNGPLHSSVSLLMASVRLLDRVPGMAISVARPTPLAIGAFYAWLAAWKVRPKRLSPAIMLSLGAVMVAAMMLLGPRRAGEFEFSVLDVGDGAAQVAVTPAGEMLLFDCGSLDQADPGERVVVPFVASRLHWSQPLRFRAAFLSHANLDHYNGLPALARRGMIDEFVYSSRSPTPTSEQAEPRPAADEPHPTAAERMHGLLDGFGVPSRLAFAGRSFRVGEVAGQILWPPEALASVPAAAANDVSQVVKLAFAGRSILLTGDINQFAEGRLLAGHAAGQIDLGADVLVMPHHGSIQPATQAFVDAVNPAWIIVSTGKPPEAVFARCAPLLGSRRKLLVTSQSGAVTVRIAPSGDLTVEPFLPNGRGR